MYGLFRQDPQILPPAGFEFERRLEILLGIESGATGGMGKDNLLTVFQDNNIPI